MTLRLNPIHAEKFVNSFNDHQTVRMLIFQNARLWIIPFLPILLDHLRVWKFPTTHLIVVLLCIPSTLIDYIKEKDKKKFTEDLKLVYKADTKELAEINLLELEEKWGKKYPIVIKSWNEKWEHLSVYFMYNKLIRKIIYTTNIIEGMHRIMRKFTKTKVLCTN